RLKASPRPLPLQRRERFGFDGSQSLDGARYPPFCRWTGPCGDDQKLPTDQTSVSAKTLATAYACHRAEQVPSINRQQDDPFPGGRRPPGTVKTADRPDICFGENFSYGIRLPPG